MSKPEMIVHPRFVEDAADLQKPQQTKLWKQLNHFLRDPNHPSLRRKRLQGTSEEVFELRVDDDYRVIYQLRSDGIPVLLGVGKHDEALRFAERWPPVVERRARVEVAEYMPLPPIPLPMPLPKLREMVSERKYYPLGLLLLAKAGSDVKLVFSQIEQVIGDLLPPSARRYRAWWGNDRNPRRSQAASWLEAGWEVSGVDFVDESVTFTRMAGRLGKA